jgi:hypothetical protein
MNETQGTRNYGHLWDFWDDMAKVLRKHDHKPGWLEETLYGNWEGVDEEYAELRVEINALLALLVAAESAQADQHKLLMAIIARLKRMQAESVDLANRCFFLHSQAAHMLEGIGDQGNPDHEEILRGEE